MPAWRAEISEFIRGAALIIHNARLYGFLDMEFTRLGLPSAREQVGEVIDTWPGQRPVSRQATTYGRCATALEVDRSKPGFTAR